MITTLALALLLSAASAEPDEPVVLVPSLAEIGRAEQRKSEYRVSLPERVTIAGRPYEITVTFGTRERFEAARDAGLENFTLADCGAVMRLGADRGFETLTKAEIVESGYTLESLIEGSHGTVSGDAVLRCLVAREPKEHSFYVDVRQGAGFM